MGRLTRVGYDPSEIVGVTKRGNSAQPEHQKRGEKRYRSMGAIESQRCHSVGSLPQVLQRTTRSSVAVRNRAD